MSLRAGGRAVAASRSGRRRPGGAFRQTDALAAEIGTSPAVRAAFDSERVPAGQTAAIVHRRRPPARAALAVSASLRNLTSHARQRGRPCVARDFQACPQSAQTRHGRSVVWTVNVSVASA